MSYTPAPWIVTGTHPTSRYIDARIGGGRLQEVAHLMGCEVGDPQDNADRICACVNACEGLSQHYLETLHPSHSSLAREMKILRDNMEAAERERDHFRKAIERISSLTLSQFSGPHDMAAECVSLALQAMARRPL